MTTALHYGPMRRPDETSGPKVTPDFWAGFSAAYLQWLQAAEQSSLKLEVPWNRNFGSLPLNLSNREAFEMLYNEAVALLQGLEPLRRMGNSEFESIIAGVRPEDSAAAGLFVSAAFNLSSATSMEGNFLYNVLGYRLPAGRKIALGPESEAYSLGMHAAGATINTGTVKGDMAAFATGGLHVNFGRSGEFGRESRNCALVNLGYSHSIFFTAAYDCIVANLGNWHASAKISPADHVMLSFGLNYEKNLAEKLTPDNIWVEKTGSHGLHVSCNAHILSSYRDPRVAELVGKNPREVAEIIDITSPIYALSKLDEAEQLNAALSIDWEGARKRLLEIRRELRD